MLINLNKNKINNKFKYMTYLNWCKYSIQINIFKFFYCILLSLLRFSYTYIYIYCEKFILYIIIRVKLNSYIFRKAE